MAYDPPGGGGGGTVTSVGMTVPAEFAVAGSPVIAAGTLAVTKNTQTANTVWAGPTTGAAAAPTFRAVVPADMPVFAASGVGHASGAVPDPGAAAGVTKFLREDATFAVPGAASPLTTKGDLFGHAAVDARVPVGLDGLLLTADSTNANGVSWGVAGNSTINNTVPSFRKRIRWLETGAGAVSAFPATSDWTFTGTGGVTVQNPDWTTNWLSLWKTLYAFNSSTAGAAASIWGATNEFSLGTRTGSGFLFLSRCAWHTVAATSRAFLGMIAIRTSIGNADPSSQINMLGFGMDAGDTQFTFMHNDGAGVATKETLNGGVGFPCNTNQADYYDFIVYAPRGSAGTVYYQAVNILTGVDTGLQSVTTNIPASNLASGIGPYWWFSVGNTLGILTQIRPAFSIMYCESDY